MDWASTFTAKGLQAQLEQAAKIGQNVVSTITEQATKTSNQVPLQKGGQEGPLIEIDQSSSSSSATITNAELERFKKMESRFVDLARAYKAIKSKQDQMEKIIIENSSIKELKLPEHFTDLERLVKSSSQSFDSEREITKLVNQINELKLANEQEASTNADMYSSMQAKLISREEEINRLKHKISKFDDMSFEGSPSEGVSDTPTTNMDQVTLKLKIRELSNALKVVTAQRNAAIEKANGYFNLNSNESLKDATPTDAQIVALEQENRSLTTRLESELNSSSALKSRLKSLKEEVEKSQGIISSLQETRRLNESTISELREHVNSIVEDMAVLSDESDMLKAKVSELNNQLNEPKTSPLLSPDPEQRRQDSRERIANLESRLKTVQQKLESSEKAKADLEKKFDDTKSRLALQTSHDSADLLAEVHKKLDLSEKKCDDLQTLVDTLNADATKAKLDADTKTTRIQALVDKKSKEFVKLKQDMDHNKLLETELTTKLNCAESALEVEKTVSQSLKRETIVLEQKIESLSTHFDAIEVKKAQIESEHNCKIRKLQANMDVNQKQNDLMAEKFKKELTEQDQKLIEWKEKASDLQKSMNTLEELNVEHLATISRLQRRFDAASSSKTETDDIGADVDLLQEEISSLKKNVERLKLIIAENDRSLSSMAAAEGEISRLRRQVQDMEAKLASSALFQEREHLSGKLLLSTTDSAKTPAALHESIRGDKADLLELNNSEEFAQLRSKITVLNESHEKAVSEIQELKSKLATEAEKFEKLNVLYNDLNVQRTTNIDQEIHSKLAEEIIVLKTERESVTDAVKTQEQVISQLKEQLNSVSQKLTEETDKKTKSIQLLRNSKNRILQLEAGLRNSEAELARLSTEHQEKCKSLTRAESSLSDNKSVIYNMTSQLEELTSRVNQLQPLSVQVDRLNLELLQERQNCSDLKADSEKQISELKNNQKDHREQIEYSNLDLSNQISQLSLRLKAADERIEEIDSDLMSSKGLFESKCVENDALKLSLSEIEVKIFDAGQKIYKLSEERISLLESTANATLLVKQLEGSMEKAVEENNNFKAQLLTHAQYCEAKDEENRLLVEEISSLKSAKAAIEDKDNAVLQQAAVDQVKMRELEEKIKSLSREKVDWIHAKDTLLQDFRMREVQLKNLNKALKEEVRKLSKSGSVSSSVVGSPRLSRSESLDYSSFIRSPRGSFKQTTLPEIPNPEPEYLKNVVLKFLESSNRSQRVQLVTVLGMLLKFSPDELARASKML